MHGVVADLMPCGGNLAGERGLGKDVLADEEEGCADAVACEQVEQVRGDGGVGTVVERERELLRQGRGDERRAAELRFRRVGRVPDKAGG